MAVHPPPKDKTSKRNLRNPNLQMQKKRGGVRESTNMIVWVGPVPFISLQPCVSREVPRASWNRIQRHRPGPHPRGAAVTPDLGGGRAFANKTDTETQII
jgi:hypothetical protein